jgi:hypothetical protein
MRFPFIFGIDKTLYSDEPKKMLHLGPENAKIDENPLKLSLIILTRMNRFLIRTIAVRDQTTSKRTTDKTT